MTSTKSSIYPHLLALIVFMAAGSWLAGCTANVVNRTITAPTATPATTINSKSGNTTLAGKIEVAGTTILLHTATNTISLASYTVDLKSYNQQMVKVTGKYSGDTLYVSQVE